MKARYIEPRMKLLRMDAGQLLDISAKDEFSPNPSYAKEHFWLEDGGEQESHHTVWDE